MRKTAVAAKLAPPSTFKSALLGLIGMVGLLVSVVGPFKVPFAESLAKTYYRQAVLGLALMVALVAGLATAAVKLFDPNQFKDQLVRWVHERTQRDLVLDGDLRVSYFPKLALESGKASLSQRRSAREFAAIDKARVTVAWLPLLRGRLHIDSAEVDGLRAQLLRLKDGSTNVDDLAHDVAAVEVAAIDLDSVRLTRASLQWNDEVAWQRGALSELNIEMGRVADGVASPLTASARVDAPAVGIDARLQAKGRLLFDSAAGRIELARIDGTLDGRALGIDNLALQVKGDLTALPHERAINADNVVVSAQHKSGLALYNSVLSFPELKWGEYRLSGSAASFDASVAHPDRSATLAVKLPRFEWAERALRNTVAQAQLSLQRGDVRLSVRGSGALVAALDGGPRLELPALEATAQLSHPALAADATARLEGRVEVDLQQHSAQASLAGQLAGSDVKVDLTTADTTGHRRWNVDAELLRLDLDALLSAGWLARWRDDATPIDLSLLHDAAAQGRVRVGQLVIAGLQLASASARFDLDRSALVLDPIAAQGYGARLEAALRLDAAGAAPHLVAKGSVNEVDLRRLLIDLGASPGLEGRGALTWDVAADGASVGSLRQALLGSLDLSLRGGALAGVDLRAALLDGRADLGKRVPAQQREFDRAASTSFSDMKARFDLRERRAKGQMLELTAPSIRAAGEGELLLDSGLLDLRLLATVGRGANELPGLAGVSVPLHVQGPWRAPRLAFDFGAASGGPLAQGGDAAAPLALVRATAARDVK
ncbi:MAG TPA: AsmA family protein [Burkholderiaceae bacterium]|nr:AsmA family protein [Burkholderiaceae bacterium]